MSPFRSLLAAVPVAHRRHVPFLALALLGASACGGGATPPPPATAVATPPEPQVIRVAADQGSPHEGEPAPDFDLPDQDGKSLKLSSLRGSVVVLAFVTSWCPFSKAEQPNLAKLTSAYAGKNVKVVAVDINEPEADYRTYLGRVSMPIPVLKDESGDVARSFAPTKMFPTFKDRTSVVVTSNLVIDPAGTIRLFGLVDTDHFDAGFVNVRREVDALLAADDKK